MDENGFVAKQQSIQSQAQTLMIVGELIEIVRAQISDGSLVNSDIQKNLNKLLDALEKHGDSDVNSFSKRIKSMKLISALRAKTKKTDRSDILASLNELYEEVAQWDSPDFDRARDRVENICKGLKKTDLVPLAKEFAGQGTTRDTVGTLREYISGRIIRRLQSKFKYASA